MVRKSIFGIILSEKIEDWSRPLLHTGKKKKTMLFTDRMQAQLQDLQSEIPMFIPDENHQQDFERIILNQVRLFRSNSPWGDWTFSFENNFRDSWIMTVVESIMECGMNDVECANRWLIEQNEAETFDLSNSSPVCSFSIQSGSLGTSYNSCYLGAFFRMIYLLVL